MKAVKGGSVQELESVLQKEPVDINGRVEDFDNTTLVNLAALKKKRLGVLKVLVSEHLSLTL